MGEMETINYEKLVTEKKRKRPLQGETLAKELGYRGKGEPPMMCLWGVSLDGGQFGKFSRRTGGVFGIHENCPGVLWYVMAALETRMGKDQSERGTLWVIAT